MRKYRKLRRVGLCWWTRKVPLYMTRDLVWAIQARRRKEQVRATDDCRKQQQLWCLWDPAALGLSCVYTAYKPLEETKSRGLGSRSHAEKVWTPPHEPNFESKSIRNYFQLNISLPGCRWRGAEKRYLKNKVIRHSLRQGSLPLYTHPILYLLHFPPKSSFTQNENQHDFLRCLCDSFIFQANLRDKKKDLRALRHSVLL